MKISIIASDLSTKGSGRWGGAIRPFILANGLKKLGYQVEIVGLAMDGDASNFSDQEIPVFSVPCSFSYSGIFNASRKVIQKIDGDIIYAVKLKTTSFGIAIIKKLLSKRPLILDIDDWELSWYGGDDFKYNPNPKQLARDLLKPNGSLKYPDHPLYLSWLEKFTNYADVITTHNQFLKKRFGGIYIPNGKDTSLFNPQNYDPETTRIKYGLADYKILMFPGAPRPYKGLEDVLTALEILNRTDLKLVIVGGSPYDDYDNELIAKGGKWIIKLPKSPFEAMPEIVSAAHIIIVPQKNSESAKAQFPLKLTDGMAMAKPIISTTVGDIPDILGETGWLVEPESPSQIAEAITEIFADYSSAQIKGNLARQRCVENYSLEKIASTLSKVMEILPV